MEALYLEDLAHTKGATSPKDGQLQRSFCEFFRGWIHTKTEVHGLLGAPRCSQSNRPTHCLLHIRNSPHGCNFGRIGLFGPNNTLM